MADAPSRSTAHAILPNLFLGPWNVSRTKDQLDEMGITHIVNVTGDYEPDPSVGRVSLYRPMEDMEAFDPSPLLPEIVEFIHEVLSDESKDHKVYVHCNAGISRSATVVLAYLMRHHHMTLKEALEHTTARRSVVAPNIGFMHHLVRWEALHKDARALARAQARAAAAEAAYEASKAPGGGGGSDEVSAPSAETATATAGAAEAEEAFDFDEYAVSRVADVLSVVPREILRRAWARSDKTGLGAVLDDPEVRAAWE